MISILHILTKGMVFGLLFLAMLFLVRSIRRFDPLKRLERQMDDWDRQRVLESGGGKQGLFVRLLDWLDRELTQAGVKRYLPKGAAEIFFLFNILEFVLVFLFVGEGIWIPLITAVFCVYLNKLLLDILRFQNRKVTENHLLTMLNRISDLALTESEITMILYQTGQMLPYPVGDALTACHFSARSSGDSGKAFYELRRSIDHPLFREIMLLLELASKNDNDYQRVVNGCRGMVHRYLKEEKEKMAVARNLFLEAGAMTLISLYGIYSMLTGFAMEAGIAGSFSEFFLQNTAGQICLVLYGGLLLGMLQIILRFARR